jgi:hypothetical protein
MSDKLKDNEVIINPTGEAKLRWQQAEIKTIIQIKDRRRRIFEQVAMRNPDLDFENVGKATESLIKAADEFAEKEIEK